MSAFAARVFRAFNGVLVTVFLFNFFAIAEIYSIQTKAQRTNDASSLRAIVQDILIHAAEDPNFGERAKDLWDFTRILAEKEAAVDPTAWIVASERNYPQNIGFIGGIQDGGRSPSFSRATISYAVALQRLDKKTPPETPVAWTRGLQPDGTWATNSPYGNKGGAIVFYSGATRIVPNINTPETQLKRHDGNGTTFDIRDALPPGTRISEYVPTPEDEASWLSVRLWQRYGGTGESRGPGFPILWTPLILCVLILVIIPKRNLPRIAKTLGLLVCLQVLLMWATY